MALASASWEARARAKRSRDGALLELVGERRVVERGSSARGAARVGGDGAEGSRQPEVVDTPTRNTPPNPLRRSSSRSAPGTAPAHALSHPLWVDRACYPARPGGGRGTALRRGRGPRPGASLVGERRTIDRNFAVPSVDRLSGGLVACYAEGGERSPSEGSFVGASVAAISSAPASRLTNSRTGSFCPAALRASGPSRVHSSASRLSASAR